MRVAVAGQSSSNSVVRRIAIGASLRRISAYPRVAKNPDAVVVYTDAKEPQTAHRSSKALWWTPTVSLQLVNIAFIDK